MDSGQTTRPQNSRASSYDMLQRYGGHPQQFDVDPDLVKKSKVVRLYTWLINVSLVTRWILFIVPVLGLLWIPGILGITAYKDTRFLSVKLIWWSIWLSVIWGGWWAALLVARILPHFLRFTIGVVAIGLRKYFDWLMALHRYVAFLAWGITVNVSFVPIILNNRDKSVLSDSQESALTLLQRIVVAGMICSIVLIGEKLAIQVIAQNFHERSYAERIADQKGAVRVLVTLYRNSSEQADRSDTLRDPRPNQVNAQAQARRFFKTALKGVREVAQSTTTVLGNVASEIAGTQVLQPNSPESIVLNALGSANKTRLLARRIFYSFKQPKADSLYPEDFAPLFHDRDASDAAFTLFDKDMNGDANREEVEMACMECHREQLSIANSMKDLDSAVGRLDNILMTLYYVIAVIIFAVAVDAKLSTLVTGFGTIVLGLSWLIGGSLQEVLTSIIFLFVKHPYDVGDRVDIDSDQFTVKEIRLLSTVFISVSKGCVIQAPHSVLNTKYIANIRRSPQMSEPFTMEVSYATTFEQVEKLRDQMLAFVKDQRRDFMSAFDVSIVDIPEQGKMILSTSIKYKSNFQQGALKSKRKNMWICALKQALSDCKIYGPSGDPAAPAGVQQVTMVPYEPPAEAGHQRAPTLEEPLIPRGNYNLADKNAVIADDSLDVYDERDELHMTNPRPTMPRPRVGPSGPAMPQMPMPGPQQMGQVPRTTGVTTPAGGYETIEMGPPSGSAGYR
ncbi:hypothetical protein EXIGLDRAFT_672416 [Exidia glandulosa HHB12029]|uniref:EF-hand domain-containing protein n=1 Tax=Exidia glandulosa HHB12029 TaxID=1314781 RepID=A0A165JNJ6_EXIGL|nr:hypothetical protein EXIGLDRAFT_672416 [Exidia glandulosa HHB12029]